MRFNEVWDEFTSGKWISRKAWKKDYAVSLVNIDKESATIPDIPILMRDTYGYLFRFGGVQTGKILRASPAGLRWVSGLQHDMLAEDWFVANQTDCDMRLKEAENGHRG